ncbi:MAG: hypothetical protein Q9219_006722 [cf. Caloplaca sp. 3 TL-2023]
MPSAASSLHLSAKDEICKLGKKKIKALARALRNVNQTPKTPGRQGPINLLSTAAYHTPIRTRNNSDTLQVTSQHLGPTPISTPAATPRSEQGPPEQEHNGQSPKDTEPTPKTPAKSAPIAIKNKTPVTDSARDSSTAWDSGAITNYGSIISSPPNRPLPFRPPSLELPDPALPTDEEAFARHNRAWRHSQPNPHVTPLLRQTTINDPHPYEVGHTHTPPRSSSSLLPRHRRLFKPRRTASNPAGPASPDRPRLIRRIFSTAGVESPQIGDVPLAGYKELDTRQAEFEKFLDVELDKIESFYKMKEQQASERLLVLRQQLHEMRDRRIEEIRALQRAKEHQKREQERLQADGAGNGASGSGNHLGSALDWRHPIDSVIGVGHHVGKNTKALVNMGPVDHGPKPTTAQAQMDRRDFQRRSTQVDDVPYRSAKRKLRLALQEFYRGLELLKSYALLNRTAFRKINKKYDKVVKARPTGRFMTEKVNKAWFVQSEVLEGQIVAVEDLYARYFERGNHKVAVGKLRSKSARAGDHTGSVFRNGLLIAAGAVFGVQGLVYGAEHLADPDPDVVTHASYLLQIPCLLWFLLGLVIWLNFHQKATDPMFLFWPVVLVVISAFVLFSPFPILYHKSREWWAYSNYRLLLAGIYPVEFRDFFLGDMYCSQTYAMGNLELFFCLYANHWNKPSQCNSTHSRLLGFFSALPGVWRALQCLRRYYDTRNAFPHLVNCGKYTFTILCYMSLSLYRIDQTLQLKAFFIACAAVNSVYCSVWDLAMDWSLGNPYAEKPFLREVLGYKSPWAYYTAMALDPILRFNWIFYVIFGKNLQHSALLSFLVSLSEILRRAMWTLFRVENEHCTNVGRFRASRDVPLPYDIPSPTPSIIEESRDQFMAHQDGAGSGQLQPTTSHMASGAQVAPDLTQPPSGSLRRRQASTPAMAASPVQRGIARVGTMMTQAHAQDFERRRRPGGTPLERQATYEGRQRGKPEEPDGVDSESEDDGEDSDRDESNAEARLSVDDILERRRSAVGG